MDNNNDSVPESAQRLCANNCGFFGSPATNNMCSLCFKKVFSDKTLSVDKAAAEMPAVVAVPTPVPELVAAMVAAPAPEPVAAAAAAVEAPAPEKATGKRKAPRCDMCKKKVGLVGITCRCGGLYCSSHRYAEQHACSFDYKGAERAELAKRNPGGGSFDKMERV